MAQHSEPMPGGISDPMSPSGGAVAAGGHRNGRRMPSWFGTWEEGHLPGPDLTFIGSEYPNRKERCEWRRYRY
jgi:hypothetical protein